MSPVIQVFAKAPVPGRVKTRLQPVLSAQQCCELHHSFTSDVLTSLEGFKAEADAELHLSEPTESWNEFYLPRKLQVGADLGERMWNAARAALDSGRPQVLLIGTDAPTLPAGHLKALLASPADIAFGPTEDGGYYAVMFRKAPHGLFDGVPWSTETTLAASVAAAERLGLQVALGPAWFDVDSPADLARLVQSPLPAHTGSWFRDHPISI